MKVAKPVCAVAVSVAGIAINTTQYLKFEDYTGRNGSPFCPGIFYGGINMSKEQLQNKIRYAKSVKILQALLQQGLIDDNIYKKANKLNALSCGEII